MADIWSFNTTLRNPERMENLLHILSETEGMTFDQHGQEYFFSLQIKNRFYRPTRNTLGEELFQKVYGSDQNEDLDDEVVAQILEKYRGEVDGAGRGRTSVAVLNRFGLCIALESHGPVVITPLGKKWLNNEIDDEELFTRFLLRWQYPNPIETGYSSFNIKPFPSTLKLIQLVNTKWEDLGNSPVGISKVEYSLFNLSIKNPDEIEETASKIIELRIHLKSLSGKDRADFMKNYIRQRAIDIFGYKNEDLLRKKIGNLKDYTDSSLRYFRITGLVSLRGAGRYIDISLDKIEEVKSIIANVSLPSRKFESDEDYLNYLGDLSYSLPWENETDLQKISENLNAVLARESDSIGIDIESIDIENITNHQKVKILKDRINRVRIKKLSSLKHDIEVLDESISKLKSISSPRYETVTARPSLDFEWFVSRALLVLNDALNITPSFKIGDDGLPTGFRGNASDIECEYEAFGLTVEVTLLVGRNQWYAEGQPVMRHLRDFENSIPSNKNSYCVFIAPYIHRDTLNQYWNSNKYGYEGRRQRIIPMTLNEFVKFLESAREKIESNSLNHNNILKFLNRAYEKVDTMTDSNEWNKHVSDIINTW